MRATQAWLAEDDAARALFAGLAADPLAGAVPLRWASALHHLALRGIEPWASIWPPQGAVAADQARLAEAIRQAWTERAADARRALSQPPQTNEVQRSAALLPGLLHIAGSTGLPLRLIEIGASAGLNLWCDRYRYEHGTWSWGDAAAPLTIACEWRGPPPAQRGELGIAHRAGCDPMPIDLQQPEEGLRLASFIWPDQPERLLRLMSAQQAAAVWMQAEGVQVEACRAAEFVARELAAAVPGQARVLMHSVVWQYIDAAEQQAIAQSVAAAAAAATPDSPLAWLRFEPIDGPLNIQLRCTQWPGSDEHPQGGDAAVPQRGHEQSGGATSAHDRLLARAHPHGAWIEWCAGS